MQTLDLIPNTPEWLAARRNYDTASEAPAMMGSSKYLSRSDLLKQKKTGITPEVDAFTQSLFDKGHDTERASRLYAEQIVGEELYPAVGVEGGLLASFDGIDIMESVVYEHKLWNEDLADQVRRNDLDPHYYWQLEQQLLVSGAERAIFVCSDGTEQNRVHMLYMPVQGRRQQLLAGWEQFKADLADYEPVVEQTAPVGRTPENLPALRIELTGMVTHSNLNEWREHALTVIGAVKTDLQTDQDFADAEKTVKWFGDSEDKLKAAKEHALSQTESIDQLFKTVDAVMAEMRAKRLELDKLVKSRKEGIRVEIQQEAAAALATHIAVINKRLGKVVLPQITADFGAAMKGKKTVKSLRDAVGEEMARAKLQANAIAEKMEVNLRKLREQAVNHAFLFTDAQQLVLRDADVVDMVIKDRIGDYEHKQADKAEQNRQAKLASATAKLSAMRSLPDMCADLGHAELLTARNNFTRQTVINADVFGDLVLDAQQAHDTTVAALNQLITAAAEREADARREQIAQQSMSANVAAQPTAAAAPIVASAAIITTPAATQRPSVVSCRSPVVVAAAASRPTADDLIAAVMAAYPDAPRHVVVHWLAHTNFATEAA